MHTAPRKTNSVIPKHIKIARVTNCMQKEAEKRMKASELREGQVSLRCVMNKTHYFHVCQTAWRTSTKLGTLYLHREKILVTL